MDEDEKDALAQFLDIYISGRPKGEQIDRLEDLAAELQERAEELRAELRAPAEPASEEA